MARRIGFLVCLAGVAAVALANALLARSGSDVSDDLFIFLRYADHAVEGVGPVWNAGEPPVEGYTSFLYLAALVPLRALGVDGVAAAHGLNVLFFVALVIAAAFLAARELGGWRPLAFLAPVLLATDPWLGRFSRGGLEWTLFSLLLLLSVWSFARSSPRPAARIGSGALFGLLVLTRPEGALVYCVCLAVQLVGSWRAGTLRRDLADERWRLVGLVALVVPHLAWRYAYYGDLVSNTYHAKVGISLPQMKRGLLGFGEFAQSVRGLWAAVAIASWFLAPRSRITDLFLALQLSFLGYVALVLGLHEWRLQYTAPLELCTMLVVATAWIRILEETLPRTTRTKRVVLAGAAAMLFLATVEPDDMVSRIRTERPLALWEAPDPDSKVGGFVVLGKKLAEIARPGETLAVSACGAIPYYSGLVTYDTLGLNDRTIARRPFKNRGRNTFGHEKGDGAYILARRPTYVVAYPFPTEEPNDGFQKLVTFEEMFALPEFSDRYRFHSLRLEDGTYFNYFRIATSDEATAANGR